MEISALGTLIIGLVIGIILTNLAFVIVSGLCQAASRTSQHLDEIDRLESKNKPKITGKF